MDIQKNQPNKSVFFDVCMANLDSGAAPQELAKLLHRTVPERLIHSIEEQGGSKEQSTEMLLQYFGESRELGGSDAQEACAFCDHKIIHNQLIMESKSLYVLHTHKPIMPGHVLIIPKRHVPTVDLMSNQEMAEVKDVVARLKGAYRALYNTEDYTLLQKNGGRVQSVPHVHFHVLPQQAEQSSTDYWMHILKFAYRGRQQPLEDQDLHQCMSEIRKKLDL